MKFAGYINTRRIKISVALGGVAGAICLYGTLTSIPGVLTLPILATIFYDRVLLGFVVGIAYGLKIHPLIRGAIIGAVVSLLIAIPSGITGGALLMGAGVVYGMVTDLWRPNFPLV
ncbi:MAG: hypothetical protein ABR985_15155 [Methanotrichaceae archaeon]|jgi:hypothetical protein